MLGEAVFNLYTKNTSVKATDIDLNEPWLEHADVRDFNTINKIISEFKPDILINLSALTSMEYCELNPDEVWATNALGKRMSDSSVIDGMYLWFISVLQEYLMRNRNITMISISQTL